MQKHHLEPIDNDLFEPLSIEQSQLATGGVHHSTWDVSWTQGLPGLNLGGIDIDSD